MTTVYTLTDKDREVLKATWKASDAHLKASGGLTERIREVCATSDKLDAYKVALIEATEASTEDKEKKAARKATIRATISRFENMKRKAEGEDKRTSQQQIIAAVALIVKLHREMSKPDLASALQPLVPVIRYSAEK